MKVRLLPIALLLSTAIGSAHATEVSVHLDATITAPGWVSQVVRPQWTATPMFGCTTTTEFSNWTTCTPPILLVCKKTVCRTPVLATPFASWDETTTFSDDCFYCIDFPDCCDITLPDILDFDEVEFSECSRSPGQIDLHLEHSLTALTATLPTTGTSVATAMREVRARFLRAGTVGLADFSFMVEISGVSAGYLREAATMGDARLMIEIESPQLGKVFRSAVVVSPDGFTVRGDIPESDFDYDEASNTLSLPNGSYPVPVPPFAGNAVEFDIRYTLETRRNWDRNGNDRPDALDIELGASLDNNVDGIPDECQLFGVVTNATGDATVHDTSSATGPEVTVSNIGSSGLDGVCIQLPASSYLGFRSGDAQSDDLGLRLLVTDPTGPGPLASLLLEPTAGETMTVTPWFAVDASDYSVRFDGAQVPPGALAALEYARCSGALVIALLPDKFSVDCDATRVTYRLEWDDAVCFTDVTGLSHEINVLELVSIPGQPDPSSAMVDLLLAGPISSGSSSNYAIAGIETAPPTCADPFVRGDVNGSGTVTFADAVALRLFLATGAPVPDPIETGDFDADGDVTIIDLTQLVQFLVGVGAPPAAPYPVAGCP